MAMYVYSTEGEPVGFLYETFIHDLDGAPLGRIIGSRVHRFDGSYVGEWYKETVVERPGAIARPLPPMTPPPHRRLAGRVLAAARRGRLWLSATFSTGFAATWTGPRAAPLAKPRNDGTGTAPGRFEPLRSKLREIG